MNVSTLTPNSEDKPAEEIKNQEGANEGEDEEIEIEEQIEEPQHEKKIDKHNEGTDNAKKWIESIDEWTKFFLTDSTSDKILMIRNEYLKNITQLLRGTILKSSIIKDSQKRKKKPIYCLSSSNIEIDKKYWNSDNTEDTADTVSGLIKEIQHQNKRF